MSAQSLGRINWTANRNGDGQRDYTVTSLVKSTSTSDGPAQAMVASGLPTIGSPWTYGNDYDYWAFCSPKTDVKPVIDKERNNYWTVKNHFSTRPLNRCQDESINDPLSEPDRISGSFVKYLEETEVDRYGNMIKSSSHEPISGIQKDATRATVSIEQNVASLNLPAFTQMMHTLNDRPLWGLAKRKIKLSSITWSRQIFGTCDFYYTRRFEFEIRFDGFDFDEIVDKGFRVFAEDGTDRSDPSDFVLYKEKHDENITEPINLDGNGSLLTDYSGGPALVPKAEIYDENNFLLLGIPSILAT